MKAARKAPKRRAPSTEEETPVAKEAPEGQQTAAEVPPDGIPQDRRERLSLFNLERMAQEIVQGTLKHSGQYPDNDLTLMLVFRALTPETLQHFRKAGGLLVARSEHRAVHRLDNGLPIFLKHIYLSEDEATALLGRVNNINDLFRYRLHAANDADNGEVPRQPREAAE